MVHKKLQKICEILTFMIGLEVGNKKLAFTSEAWKERKECIRYSLEKKLEIWIYGVGREIDENTDLVTSLILPEKIIRTDYLGTPLKVELLKKEKPENFKEKLKWHLKRIYAEIEHPWIILGAYFSNFLYSTLLKKPVLISTGTSVWGNEVYENKARDEEVIYVLHTHPASPSPSSPKLTGGDIKALMKRKVRWVELVTPYDDLFAPLAEFSEAEMWEILGVEFKKWFDENKGRIREYGIDSPKYIFENRNL